MSPLPTPTVHIDDYNGFVANILNVVIGWHGPDGLMIHYTEPMLTLAGPGPVYHPFTAPYVAPPKKTAKASGHAHSEDADETTCSLCKAEKAANDASAAGVVVPDECAWLDDGMPCGRVKDDHEKPRLSPKLGDWMVTQKVLGPGEHMPEVAYLRIPRQFAREVGEALVEWADKNSPLKATDVEVTREALLIERMRVDKMLDALIDLAGTPPQGELFTTEVAGS